MTIVQAVSRAKPDGSPHPTPSKTWTNLGALALLGVLSAFASGHPGDNFALLALIGGCAALITAWISLAVHELGHAVVSALVGGPVLKLRIGSGPGLRTRHLFGARIVLRLLPTDGRTTYLRPIGSALRARLLMRASAGVIFNIALVGLAITLLSGYLLPIILLVNAWMILSSLVPYTARLSDGELATDGLVLIRLARKPL